MKKEVSKKGQVTIFILIGLVLVLFVSVVVYVSNQSMLFKSSKFLPGDVKPAAEYVELCVEETGREAVFLAGQQGGYVNLPEYLDNNPLANIEYSWMKVPYWYYEGTDSSPSIEVMQNQIGGYIDDNLGKCVDNMSIFTEEFDVEILSAPETNVIFGRKDVVFETNYHIVLKDKLGKTKLDIEEFKTSIPVALKKVYEFAQRILEKENSEMFLEKATIDMMGMNPDIPFTGLNFECVGGPMEWAVSDINNEIKDALRKDIPRIRIKNSDYVSFDADEGVYEELAEFDVDRIAEGEMPENIPQDAYDYFHYFWDIKYDKSDLKVGFNYLPEFGDMLKVRPSSNGIMKSNVAKGTKYLSFLCLHIYHFSYDLNYPVEISISDEDSYNGEGYVFKFAIPVMIDHNLPNREKVTSSIFDYYESNRDYSLACDNKEGKYDVVIHGYDDYLYESELEDVEIYYDCLRYGCDLGLTAFESGSSYKLETGLPVGCLHGFIEANKEGYLTTRKQVLSSDMEMGLVELWMPKLEEFNYTIVTQKYDPVNESFGPEEEFNGTSTLHLTLDGTNFEEIKVNNDKINMVIDPAKTYLLEITLLNEDEELIGGFKGNWTVSYDDLKNKENIVFRTFEYWPYPENEEDLMDMYLFMFEGDYQEELKSRFE